MRKFYLKDNYYMHHGRGFSVPIVLNQNQTNAADFQASITWDVYEKSLMVIAHKLIMNVQWFA